LEVMTAALPQSASGGLGMEALAPLLELCQGKKALAIGPGLGNAPETFALVRALVAECPVPMVVDADGLNALAGHTRVLQKARAPVILTPHPGEMARLCNTETRAVQQNRIGMARTLASDLNVCCVLKGARTIVALPNGFVAVNPTGNPGMASGGMGDVLTGVTGAFLAQGLLPEHAAQAGVFVHGMAADACAAEIGAAGYLASDCMAALPRVLERLHAF